MRPALPVLALALAACYHDHDDDDGGSGIPVFVERERNDDPLVANHFGSLRPGDQFFIDGFVRDDLADPFDGFAFTAAVPLHVDFELFIDNSAADLDVCLYDPLIDQTVACFATSENPERGGVDVFAGGLDFHLVVESFLGDSSYSLAITVLPLYGREALLEAGASPLRGVEARAEHATESAAGYTRRAPAPRVVLEQIIDVDLERGIVIERVRVR